MKATKNQELICKSIKQYLDVICLSDDIDSISNVCSITESVDSLKSSGIIDTADDNYERLLNLIYFSIKSYR